MASLNNLNNNNGIDRKQPLILIDVDYTLYHPDRGLNEKLIVYLRGKPNIYLFTKMNTDTVQATIESISFIPGLYHIRKRLREELALRDVNINGIITPSDVTQKKPGDFYKKVLEPLEESILRNSDSDYYKLMAEFYNTKQTISADLLEKNINDNTKATMFDFTYDYFQNKGMKNITFVDDEEIQLGSALFIVQNKQNPGMKVTLIKSIDDRREFLPEYKKLIETKEKQPLEQNEIVNFYRDNFNPDTTMTRYIHEYEADIEKALLRAADIARPKQARNANHNRGSQLNYTNNLFVPQEVFSVNKKEQNNLARKLAEEELSRQAIANIVAAEGIVGSRQVINERAMEKTKKQMQDAQRQRDEEASRQVIANIVAAEGIVGTRQFKQQTAKNVKQMNDNARLANELQKQYNQEESNARLARMLSNQYNHRGGNKIKRGKTKKNKSKARKTKTYKM